MTARALAMGKQARTLPETERERLAECFLTAMKDESLTAVDETWVAEAEKRFSVWNRKGTRAVSAAKALCDIRKDLLC